MGFVKDVLRNNRKGGENQMTQLRVRAGSSSAARRKCGGERTTVTKVNYLPGTERRGMKTYAVTTKNKKK